MDFSRCCESEDILDDDPGKFIRWVIHFMSCLFRDTQKQSYWKFQFETGHYLVQWSAVIVTLLPIPDSFILTLIEWQSVIVTLLPIPEGVTVIADRRSLHFFNASQLISTFGPSSQSMCNERGPIFIEHRKRANRIHELSTILLYHSGFPSRESPRRKQQFCRSPLLSLSFSLPLSPSSIRHGPMGATINCVSTQNSKD